MACLLSLGLLGQLMPSASAYDATQRPIQRPRHGDQTWMPAYVSVASDFTTSGGIRTNTYTFKFKYEQAPERFEADGSEQILEVNLKIPCRQTVGGWVNPWAEYEDGSGQVNQPDYPTNGAGWSVTNIPNAAHPFEDTMFGDTCIDDSNHDVSVGFGIGDLSQLTSGTEYAVTFRTVGTDIGDPADLTYEPEVKLLVQTGTNYDTGDPPAPWGALVPLEKTCSYNSEANAEWNQQDNEGYLHRRKAAWCTWIDYQHRVVEPDSANPVYVGHDGTEYKRYLNLLNQDSGQSNDGRMERTDQNPDNSSWTKKATLGAGTLSTVCSGAYEGSCMLQISGAPYQLGDPYVDFIWADHIQSFTSGQGDQLSAGAEVQCPPNNGTGCKLAILLYGYNQAPGQQPTNIEFKRIMTTLPDNGQWYLCRIDNGGWDNDVHGTGETKASHQDDGSAQGALNATTFGWQNATVKDKLEIAIGTRWDDDHVLTPVTLNIDNVHVGGKSEELNPAAGYGFTPTGVGMVDNTSICSPGIS